MSNWTYPTYLQSFEESKVNAYAIYAYFKDKMTIQAICGLLGNIWRESHISPVLQESGGSGYGLIQWTPKSALTSYCYNRSLNPNDGDVQCYVIEGEGKGISGLGGRWLPNLSSVPPQYKYSWAEFTQLTDIDTSVYTYLYCRERAGVAAITERLEYAHKYYEYLTGQPAPPPVIPPSPIASETIPNWFIPVMKNLKNRKVLK